MGGKAGNLNSVTENQDSDLNLQVASGDILTRQMLNAFKFVTKPGKARSSNVLKQSHILCA
jgi:hypothetical protein